MSLNHSEVSLGFTTSNGQCDCYSCSVAVPWLRSLTATLLPSQKHSQIPWRRGGAVSRFASSCTKPQKFASCGARSPLGWGMSAIFILDILVMRLRVAPWKSSIKRVFGVSRSLRGATFSSKGIDWHEGLNVGDTVVQYLMIEPL